MERRVTSDPGWALFPGVGDFLDAHHCCGHPGVWKVTADTSGVSNKSVDLNFPHPTSNRHFELHPPTPEFIIHTGLPPVWPGLCFLILSDLHCDSFPSRREASHCYFRHTKAGGPLLHSYADFLYLRVAIHVASVHSLSTSPATF